MWYIFSCNCTEKISYWKNRQSYHGGISWKFASPSIPNPVFFYNDYAITCSVKNNEQKYIQLYFQSSDVHTSVRTNLP